MFFVNVELTWAIVN